MTTQQAEDLSPRILVEPFTGTVSRNVASGKVRQRSGAFGGKTATFNPSDQRIQMNDEQL